MTLFKLPLFVYEIENRIRIMNNYITKTSFPATLDSLG